MFINPETYPFFKKNTCILTQDWSDRFIPICSTVLEYLPTFALKIAQMWVNNGNYTSTMVRIWDLDLILASSTLVESGFFSAKKRLRDRQFATTCLQCSATWIFVTTQMALAVLQKVYQISRVRSVRKKSLTICYPLVN